MQDSVPENSFKFLLNFLNLSVKYKIFFEISLKIFEYDVNIIVSFLKKFPMFTHVGKLEISSDFSKKKIDHNKGFDRFLGILLL